MESHFWCHRQPIDRSHPGFKRKQHVSQYFFYDYMKSPKSSADISCSFLITNSQLIAVGQKGFGSVICKCQWVVAFLRAVIIPLSSVCFFPTFSISQLLCPSLGGFTVRRVTLLSILIYEGVQPVYRFIPHGHGVWLHGAVHWCVCAREVRLLTCLRLALQVVEKKHNLRAIRNYFTFWWSCTNANDVILR